MSAWSGTLYACRRGYFPTRPVSYRHGAEIRQRLIRAESFDKQDPDMPFGFFTPLLSGGATTADWRSRQPFTCIQPGARSQPAEAASES